MLEHLMWPHGIELVQHWKSAELNEWRRSCKEVILSLLLIEENYESPYVAYPPEGHTYIHDSPLYQDGAAKLAVDKAIS